VTARHVVIVVDWDRRHVSAAWVIDGALAAADFARAISEDIDPAIVAEASDPVAELLYAREAELDYRDGPQCRTCGRRGEHPPHGPRGPS
jgi:hypothetical protein